MTELGLAEALGRRGLWAVVPYGPGQRPEGLVLASDDGGAPLDVDVGEAKATVRPWLRRTDRVFWFDDAKADLRRLLRCDMPVARPICRTTLKTLAGRMGGLSEEHTWRPAFDAAEARDRAWSGLGELSAQLEDVARAGHRRVARLECLVLPAFAALEERGLHLDTKRWGGLVDDARKRSKAARAEVFELMGDAVQRDLFGEPDLNLDADLEVKAVLERLLGRELPDVAKRTLRELGHDVGPALLRFREAHKIVTTYGDAFLEHVGSDGRVRATFFPLGASTGRVASRDPNLQNLPSDQSFHECLRAPEGRRLVTADYGTCELRILADLSEDEAFLEAFERGDDLHSVVASRMFQKPVSKTENAELRVRAKAINFGLMYGMGAVGLARQVGVELPEAEELLEKYFNAYPRVRDYLEQSVERAVDKGYAETVLGRRLTFDEATLSSARLADGSVRGELSRVAKNMPIQGTSADMTKLAMARVHERLLEHDDAGLVNTIHDELVVECSEGEADAVAQAVVEEMEAAHRTLLTRVPPQVDVHVGPHWVH